MGLAFDTDSNHTNRHGAATHACRMESVPMIDRYNRLPPEEQRIVIITLLGAAASLWLSVAWEEIMVLAALPVLAGICWGLIRVARKRAERHKEKLLY